MLLATEVLLERSTTVTLAAHARRGLILKQIRARSIIRTIKMFSGRFVVNFRIRSSNHGPVVDVQSCYSVNSLSPAI